MNFKFFNKNVGLLINKKLAGAVLATTAISIGISTVDSPSAYACNSGISRLDPTCPGRILGPDRGPADSEVGGPSWSRIQQNSINLINRTGEDIYFVYMTPSDYDSWDDDILGPSKILARNEEFRFSAYASDGCQFDIQYETSSGDVDEIYGVDICRYSNVSLR